MCFYIIFWLYIRPLYNIILVECGIHNKNSIMIIFPLSKFVPRRFCSARVFASRFPEISWSIGWFLMPNQTFWVRISRLEIWHNKFLNYICQTYIEVIVWSHVKIIKIFRFSCTKQSKFISIFTLFSVRETCIYPPYFSYIPSLFSYLFLFQPLKFLSSPSSVFAVNFQRAIISLVIMRKLLNIWPILWMLVARDRIYGMGREKIDGPFPYCDIFISCSMGRYHRFAGIPFYLRDR